jgi:hypothetical protein
MTPLHPRHPGAPARANPGPRRPERTSRFANRNTSPSPLGPASPLRCVRDDEKGGLRSNSQHAGSSPLSRHPGAPVRANPGPRRPDRTLRFANLDASPRPLGPASPFRCVRDDDLGRSRLFPPAPHPHPRHPGAPARANPGPRRPERTSRFANLHASPSPLGPASPPRCPREDDPRSRAPTP